MVSTPNSEVATMDTQQVEIIGRNLLVSACVADSIEVSEPIRDRGIDLIIFNDTNEQGSFNALPVQLKASSKRSFSVNAKYAKFPNLLMAYTWHSDSPTNARLYIMKYSDAINIADEMGWLKTVSWERGGYSTQNPSSKIEALLSPYLYKPGSIKSIMKSIS